MYKKKEKIKFFLVFLTPSLFLYILFVVYPYIQSFYISLFRWRGLSRHLNFVGLANFQKLFRDNVFWIALKNNFVILIFAGLIILVIAMFFAVIISYKIKGAIIFRITFFFPSLISFAAIAVLWSFIYNPSFGLLNSFLRLLRLDPLTHTWLGKPQTALPSVIITIIWYYAGFYMIIFLSTIQSIPPGFFEAAKLDGANSWQAFWHITLPLLREIIKIAVVYIIINALNIFDLIYIMTSGGPNRHTEVLSTYMYEQAFKNSNFGYATSISVVLFILTLGMSILFLKILTKGKAVEY